MRAGQLNRRVQIEKTQAASDFGNAIQEKKVIAEVWASIQPLRGSEQLEAQQIIGRTTYKITTRWITELANLDASDSVRSGDKRYEITSVANIDDRNKTIEMICVL